MNNRPAAVFMKKFFVNSDGKLVFCASPALHAFFSAVTCRTCRNVFLPVKKIFCFILHKWRTAGRGGKRTPGARNGVLKGAGKMERIKYSGKDE